MFGSLVASILLIWMLFRIARQSILLAVLSFFFWPALIFAVFRYWGDEESDIKVPFAIFLPIAIWLTLEMDRLFERHRTLEETLHGIAPFLA